VITHLVMFDALYITDRLTKNVGSASRAELHLFGYLGCLLSIYEGRPASEWGYTFAATAWGSPYNPNLDDCLAVGIRAGLIEEGDWLTVTQRGGEVLAELACHSQHNWRVRMLAGATDAALCMPTGLIRRSLSPVLPEAPTGRNFGTRFLLDEGSQGNLHSEFAVLSAMLGNDNPDLMVPATVWLGYHWELVGQRETSGGRRATAD
jgi:hypothetical protein